MNSNRYIAIEGPIGVGKTTLASRLAQSLGTGILSEAPEDNPFLSDFYDNPRGYALSAQLSFLLQRARQIDGLRQVDLFENGCVADFMFDKDPLFARLNLHGAELALYEEIYNRLAWQSPVPDCVIYLYAPVDVLMARVALRDRVSERKLEADYMAHVVAAYADFFCAYNASRLICVDAAELDLVSRDADYVALLAALQSDQWRIDLPPNRSLPSSLGEGEDAIVPRHEH